MKELFQNVPTLHFSDDGMAYITREDRAEMMLELDCVPLNMSQARKLRDWLNQAIDPTAKSAEKPE